MHIFFNDDIILLEESNHELNERLYTSLGRIWPSRNKTKYM